MLNHHRKAKSPQPPKFSDDPRFHAPFVSEVVMLGRKRRKSVLPFGDREFMLWRPWVLFRDDQPHNLVVNDKNVVFAMPVKQIDGL